MPKDRAVKIKGYEEQFSEASKSQYSITDVLGRDEFLSLSKQLKIGLERQSKLCDSFYGKSWKQDKNKRFERPPETTIYERSYNDWKKEIQPSGDFESTYQSALALVSNQHRKKEVKRLIKDYSVEGALLKCSESNPPLQKIKDSYSKSFNQLIAQPMQISNSDREGSNLKLSINHLQQLKKEKQSQETYRRQKLIQLQIQEVLLNKIRKINEKEIQMQTSKKALEQMKKACFSDIIKRPPIKLIEKEKNGKRQSQKLNFNHKSQFFPGDSKVNFNSNSQQLLKKKQQKSKALNYRLKVEQILKIPHRLFLIFYSENYHQIVRLSTPEELKQINCYRQQALLRQQAFEKLKKKVQNEDPETIARLPHHMKEKLFKVLYDQNVEEQKYYQKD